MARVQVEQRACQALGRKNAGPLIECRLQVTMVAPLASARTALRPKLQTFNKRQI